VGCVYNSFFIELACGTHFDDPPTYTPLFLCVCCPHKQVLEQFVAAMALNESGPVVSVNN
jgi:hypothetical protein